MILSARAVAGVNAAVGCGAGVVTIGDGVGAGAGEGVGVGAGVTVAVADGIAGVEVSVAEGVVAEAGCVIRAGVPMTPQAASDSTNTTAASKQMLCFIAIPLIVIDE
jgi:hypothetical protein